MKPLFIPLIFLMFAGLVTLSSVDSSLFRVQLVWILLGVAIVVISRKLNMGPFLHSPWLVWGLYGVALLLLVITYFTAPSIRNVRSWLVVGPLRFQPVELAKVALIAVFASYFSRRHIAIARARHIFASLGLFIAPAALTLLQPDLGSVLVLFSIWFGLLIISGLPRKWIVAAFVLGAVGAIVAWSFFLADYQKARIVGVVNPERDTLGINYSVTQSKIAIGSAGLFGKGYGQGTETQLGFLSEPATDFIFSAFVEEWGIVFGVIFIAAFVWLLISILSVGRDARTNFEKFFCMGTAIVFGVHFLINIGSALGLIPVIGIPIPFVSYGGSSMLTSFLLFAVVYDIERRSKG